LRNYSHDVADSAGNQYANSASKADFHLSIYLNALGIINNKASLLSAALIKEATNR
jgi:hypothetical protein